MSHLLPRLFATAALALAAAAQAAPVVSSTSAVHSFSFSEYAGAGPLGFGQLGDNDAVYWVHEGTGTYKGKTVDSWFLVFEPNGADRVKGSLRFDGRIEAVFDSKSELLDSRRFASDEHSYDIRRLSVGLEGYDTWTASGSALKFDWRGGFGGDHVRVLTRSTSQVAIDAPIAPIPEPSTYALMASGLLAVMFMARRRRQED
jgi:opacity protein-like surface antigen